MSINPSGTAQKKEGSLQLTAYSLQLLKQPFDACLTLPGSKSEVNRVLIAAALSEGTTTIHNVTPFDDVCHMVNGLQILGFGVQWNNNKTSITVSSPPNPLSMGEGELPPSSGGRAGEGGEQKTLLLGNAGTAVRFLTTLACIVPGNWIITGDEYMQKRPIAPLVEALRQLGADIEDTNGCPPLTIKGGTLRGGTCTLDASKSSQYLTSLLLAAPALEEDLSIKLTTELTSKTYLDLTQTVLKKFGVDLQLTTNNLQQLTISQSTTYNNPSNYSIEGDWSAAGAWLVLAELTHSRVRFTNLNPKSSQGDRLIISILKKMREDGDLTVDCEPFPDQTMNLAVRAAFRNGKTTFVNAGNLRIKECNRIAATVETLTACGITCEETKDGLSVEGSYRLPLTAYRQTNEQLGKQNLREQINLTPYDDHRMAMMQAILGSIIPNITIDNPGCVSKSYPEFWDDLEAVQRSKKCIAIIGMRGCGKSVLGKRLSSTLRMKHVDSDQVIEKRHGPIGALVEQKDWAYFREKEEEAIGECLQPGCIVSLGGGAIETADVRTMLQKHAIVLWIHATLERILDHLKRSKTKRPALTDMNFEEEIRSKLQERDPIYQELANITLPDNTPYKEHIPFVTRSLQKLCTL